MRLTAIRSIVALALALAPVTALAAQNVVSVPVQGAVLLNAAPTTSAANAAANITLAGAANTRVCIRTISVYGTGGQANVTVSDGATVVLDFGPRVFGSVTSLFQGDPLLCGTTGNDMTVTVGALGAGQESTASVIADHQ